MDNYRPVIQEFIARKDQILNLEIMLFILVFVLELVFVMFYIFFRSKLEAKRSFVILALSVYFVIFFQMVAINGKMGLVSMYLKQLESFLALRGFPGVIWESKALRNIIFVLGNAFTLPALLAILVLLFQTFYVVYFSITTLLSSRIAAISLTTVICVLILLLVVKTVTVDFFRKPPNIFLD